VLRHIPDAVSARLGHILENADAARMWPLEAEQQFEYRGLAGPVRPDKRGEFAVMHMEIDGFQDGNRIIRKRNIVEPYRHRSAADFIGHNGLPGRREQKPKPIRVFMIFSRTVLQQIY